MDQMRGNKMSQRWVTWDEISDSYLEHLQNIEKNKYTNCRVCRILYRKDFIKHKDEIEYCQSRKQSD